MLTDGLLMKAINDKDELLIALSKMQKFMKDLFRKKFYEFIKEKNYDDIIMKSLSISCAENIPIKTKLILKTRRIFWVF